MKLWLRLNDGRMLAGEYHWTQALERVQAAEQTGKLHAWGFDGIAKEITS